MDDNIRVRQLYLKKILKYQKALSEIANEDLDYIRKQPFDIKQIVRKALEYDTDNY
jgi:hypothetical protein